MVKKKTEDREKELRWQQWAAKALFFVGGFG